MKFEVGDTVLYIGDYYITLKFVIGNIESISPSFINIQFQGQNMTFPCKEYEIKMLTKAQEYLYD